MKRNIGEMIKGARKRANMTQGELGSLIGVTAPAICELEAGNRSSSPNPDDMVQIADAVHDVKLMQDYCESCPLRKRIIIRKFKPLNNILPGAHVSTLKVCQKMSEASEKLSVMVPKMLRKGFEADPDFREHRNETIIAILDAKRGTEILIDQLLEQGLLNSDELQVLVEMQQHLCEAKGHHVPESAA